MAKDSYQRFLKSEQYLQILNGPILSNGNMSDGDSSCNVIMRSGSTRDSSAARKACASRRHTCVPDQSETPYLY